MSFKSCDETVGAGAFFRLENDGETAELVIVGEPVPRQSTYAGVIRDQAVFPVVSANGLQSWTVGSRLYRKVRDNWAKWGGRTLRLTRHGAKGDQGTRYDIAPVAANRSLLAAVKKLTEQQIADSLKAAAGSGMTTDQESDIPF